MSGSSDESKPTVEREHGSDRRDGPGRGGSRVLSRFYELVDLHPEKTALIYAPEHGDEIEVSWEEFDRMSTRIARLFRDEYGVNETSTVVAATRNSHLHYFVTYAAWKLGALALPLRAELPARERDEILDLARPAVVYADWTDLDYPVISPEELKRAEDYSDERLSNIHPHPGKAISSGGSTGHSKIIVDRTWDPSVWRRTLGMTDNQVQLMAAPLYHNSPALIGNSGLMKDHVIVVMQRFTPEQAVDLIERHRVNYAYLPPIIMQRIARMPEIEQHDLSSIEAFHSSAAVCPAWLKQWWIDHIGPEKVWEVYGSSEGIGATMIRGDEWLEHPGSVGRPSGDAELKILDEDQRELPAGEVGEIYMRTPPGPTFEYLGAPKLEINAGRLLFDRRSRVGG
ncbi:MAG: AMP-binding protein [Thermomicrobiales bacterium]